MPDFRFRLATLLRLRETARDERRRALAEAYRAAQIVREQQAQVQDELAALVEQQRAATRPGRVEVDRLIAVHRHDLVLRVQERELARQSQQLSAEIERRRELLVAADRVVRVLEKLRQHQRARRQADEMRREINELDEFAIERAARQESSAWPV
jgi:flagellar export protein FliJ